MDKLTADFKSFTRKGAGGPEAGRRAVAERGRQSFRAYCNAINPGFFRPDREYQDVMCSAMQDFYEGRLFNPDGRAYDIFILNLPPGFGKSYTASMFATWAYGRDTKTQVISVSYNQTLSVQSAKAVRDLINEMEVEGDAGSYAVRSFFPWVRIKHGDGAMERWSIEGYYNSYLATSFGGSITGMRGSLGIIDDPIKNSYEAVNDNVKEAHWEFYKNTFASRILDGGKQFAIQTRWATDDLAGRLIDKFPQRCYVLSMQALTPEGRSLCENLYSTGDLRTKEATIDPHIWSANYMQIPVDIKGALYGGFKIYDEFDFDAAERVIAYIDTADEGADSLCCVCGAVAGRYGYVTDIYYTDEAMEATEPETARRLAASGVREAVIESNNGGRGFARSVARELGRLGAAGRRCNVTWFHQSKNKRTRIIVNSASAMGQVIMPAGWEQRWPGFAKAIKAYQRKGKNAHDDAADALTGFVELINGDVKGRKKARVGRRADFGL